MYYSNEATLNIKCDRRCSISTPTLRVFQGQQSGGWIRGFGVGRGLRVTFGGGRGLRAALQCIALRGTGKYTYNNMCIYTQNTLDEKEDSDQFKVFSLVIIMALKPTRYGYQ